MALKLATNQETQGRVGHEKDFGALQIGHGNHESRKEYTDHRLTLLPDNVIVGGADPKLNPWLARLINDAKRIDMPKRNIEDAIGKASKVSSGTQFLFEGRLRTFYFLIECQSDNKARAEQQVRKVLQDNEATYYDTTGHVKWLFKKTGVVEMYAPLMEKEMRSLQKAMVELQSWIFDKNPTPPPLSKVEEYLESKEVISMKKPIMPSSISSDSLMNALIDLGAEDINVVHVPAAMALSSTDLPFNNLKLRLDNDEQLSWYDLSEHLPPIETIQALFPADAFNQTQQELRKLSFFGHRPFIYRDTIMFIPQAKDYDTDMWQSLEGEEDGGKQVLTILDKLRQIDEVTEIWHNIRHLQPWQA